MPQTPDCIWSPDPSIAGRTRMAELIRRAGEKAPEVTDYLSLHAWSLKDPEAFWALLWDFFELKSSEPVKQALVPGESMPDAQWFPGARLNFAEHLLRRRDDGIALIACDERGERGRVSYAELYAQVAHCAASLRKHGLGPGDRVAAVVNNTPAAIVTMLAVSSIGAIWSSCSPDFGTAGALERFAQIEPKLLFAVDRYQYNGKSFEVLKRAGELAAQLPSVEQCIVISEDSPAPKTLPPNCRRFNDLLGTGEPPPLEFAQLPFDHPLYILYSSGTTGAPKCIVHGAGGALMQHMKEQQLHINLGERDRLFFYSTCGWMMWNWLAGGLASGAALVLYDGAPLYPDAAHLWQLAEQLGISVFGASARYYAELEKGGVAPGEVGALADLRLIISTGSALQSEQYDYLRTRVKRDIPIMSVSGGTDILGCFVLGNLETPLYRGEIQGAALGMAVSVADADGHMIREEKGELVCTKPFPSQPLGFWGQPRKRYISTYFAYFPGIWRQGDYAEQTARGGFILHGRSDATLNRGGVRIGTGEIYTQVNQLEEILEAVCIGQPWQGDTRLILFVKLRPDAVLDDALAQNIRRTLREHASPRHVPDKILAVPDIPRTLSGKTAELAVKSAVEGAPVKNTRALANPEALAHFRELPELAA